MHENVGSLEAGTPFGSDALAVALSRRQLLELAGATAALAMLSPGILSSAVPAADSALAPAATGAGPWLRSRFAPHLGESFRLAAPGGAAVHAKLDAIDDLTASGRPAAGAEQSFILLFHGPTAPRIEQDVLRVSHPQLGTLEMLVSPAGTGRRGQDYAAVINRQPPTTRRTGAS